MSGDCRTDSETGGCRQPQSGPPVGPAPLLEAITQTPPACPPGERAVYSDLGFILVGAWLGYALSYSFLGAVSLVVAAIPEMLPALGLALDAAGSEARLRQVFDNLLSNACRYTASEGRISVKAREADGRVTVEIADTGIGIDERQQERVFERFYSLPRPDTGQKSSGLGLTFAREVAQLHGGTLVLENRRPGTRARLLLPVGKS